MAAAKEVYITILFPGRESPFDRISFKASPEQLTDCEMIAAKYEALIAAK